MSVSNRVSTITKNFLAPKVAEGVLQSNVGLTRFISAAKPWRGAQEEVPFKHAKNTQGGSFDGFDVLSTTSTDNRIKLTFDPKFTEKPVVIPLTDLAKNMTEERVLDLMEIEMESTAVDMADDLGTQFYSDGTGNSSKDMTGLAAIVDDGTLVSTYGGQSRSTYTALNATLTASSGTLSLAKMATLANACTFGNNKPTVGLTTQTVFSLYEQLLVPQERIQKPVGMIKGLDSGTGFVGLSYRGFPVLADQKCTSGKLIFLNEDSIDFRAIKIPEAEAVNFSVKDMSGSPYSNVKGLGFAWTGWVKPVNQLSLVGRVVFGGNLICSNPRFNAALTGCTSV